VPSSRPLRLAGWIFAKILYGGWVALMILTPLFGFWLASSLAAYENATQWLSLGIGLLLFPVLPLGWDLIFVWRRRRRGDTGKPILTRLDRLVLRTLIINGVFLGIMMWQAPHTAFRALAVRGDWIVDGDDGPIASRVRGALLGVADQFERRWHRDDSTFGTSDKPPDPSEHDRDTPVAIPDIAKPVQPADSNGWPLPAAPDPAVTSIPAEAQTSVEAVGQYFAARFTDKRQLVKALHDYVVLRLSYDVATSKLSDAESRTMRPSQQADAVFAARTGVCEGYARLFAALGKAAGVEIAYVTGYIRDVKRRVDETGTEDAIKHALEGYLHAWNAVKIDGKWLLVDTTWDDPVGGAPDQIETTYLFTPPRLFAFDHLPEQAAWQLVDKPIGAGDFARQPLLRPYIGRLGIVLEEPTRSQITADGSVEISLVNPYKATVDVEIVGQTGACKVAAPSGIKQMVTCDVPAGQHEIRMFGAPGTKARELDYFGSILVNGR
jgi:hypothetical protein